MLYKSVDGCVKEMGEGTARVVFATMNVIDKDGDVTLPGAFGNQVAKISPAHDWKAPGMGLAQITEVGDEAIADLTFNLEMASASEWYKSLKFNFDKKIPQEFSYGFDIKDHSRGDFQGKGVRFLKSLKVDEVSPVMRGAGVDTRLVNVKQHTVSGSWEEAQSALRAAAHTALLGDQDGWVSIEATFSDRVIASVYYPDEAEPKFYQFSWSMGDDGPVLSSQTEVELDTVVRMKGLMIDDQFTRLLGDCRSFVGRSKALSAWRTQAGRKPSHTNGERLKSLLAQLPGIQTSIKGLIEPEKQSNRNAEALRLVSEYQLAIGGKRNESFGASP